MHLNYIIWFKKKKQNNLEIYSTNLNIEDRYSIFENSNKYIFNDTKFYKVLETYINILENQDINNQSIDLFYLREYIYKFIHGFLRLG